MPLVNLVRSNGASIAINPEYVGAVFNSAHSDNEAIVRMADGRGFLVQGSHESLRSNFPMMLDFDRANVAVDEPSGWDEEGEDDEPPQPIETVVRKIGINPLFVGAAFTSNGNPNVSIIRMGDGRGFTVIGSGDQIVEALANGGRIPADRAN
jgi:hypothetical protein